MRIVVTRPEGQAAELAERLEELGHEILVCPLIEVEPLGEEPIELSGYDWVLVTSPNGARELARRRRGRPGRVAAIGPGTAAALASVGLPPDLVARRSTQEGLLAELPLPAGRVLVAAAEGARPLLRDELRADFAPLYRTKELRPLVFPDADLVLLTSASAARAYAALDRATPAVSVGPETTKEARRGGVRVVAEASSHDLEGLVAAINGVRHH